LGGENDGADAPEEITVEPGQMKNRRRDKKKFHSGGGGYLFARWGHVYARGGRGGNGQTGWKPRRERRRRGVDTGKRHHAKKQAQKTEPCKTKTNQGFT